ncbi:PREDICTED: mitochondrial tRNA-specific 2-thiouridylase 1 [Nicrophorus vespilloides]|uniref:tRNA-5-taurinomethyluridine 2-sulfurtransferase n=1 Tax=Nicrophorus vespilloides TaxID=110193 RepID=A0ABM1N500_NICVS|nr:PREDICTED: mitochondrial tRNA-specific 2-thiouridylase 1 [Nicrophorus vespilloides]
MLNIRKVAVGLSGGVDSAVTAFLLKQKGYDVKGVFMQNWDLRDEFGKCSSEEDYKDAQVVAKNLKIPLKHVKFVKEYWNEVFLNLLKDYETGYTPNPDILCNRHVKFNYFYKYARDVLKVDAIATGHYARTNFGSYLENFNENENVKLLRAKDDFKDQTFFLCQIGQEALRRTMFPLGTLLKSEVKEIAAKNGLEKFAAKKESMGICFIGERNFQGFISEYISDKVGNFVDIESGKIVGQHTGIHKWTIGQRSKLGGFANPYYVAKKEVDTNTIYVASGSKNSAFHSSLFFTSKPHWINKQPKELLDGNIFECQFKFQHTHDLINCELCETSKGLVVWLSSQKRALTAGQYAVFYKNDECLGGARMMHIGPSNFSLYWLQNNNKCKVTRRLYKYEDNKKRAIKLTQ